MNYPIHIEHGEISLAFKKGPNRQDTPQIFNRQQESWIMIACGDHGFHLPVAFLPNRAVSSPNAERVGSSVALSCRPRNLATCTSRESFRKQSLVLERFRHRLQSCL
jgi:hypothetical protein